jgi:hypothetical protein
MLAAVVTTLLYVPAGALLAGLLFLAGASPHTVLTFDRALNAVQGLIAWWALGFVPALAYVAYALPWSRRDS